VLLLPKGITARLTPAQLKTIVAHEMHHVRRRDNLTAAIHMAIESIFWFYPLVWWIGKRLVDERERACDEGVLQSSGEPETYAEGILNVCKFYAESPLACVSGITGSDLKGRIVRIMTQQAATRLSVSRKLLLATVALASVVGPVTFGIANAPTVSAQLPSAREGGSPTPSFEVASIRPDRSGQAFNSQINPGRCVMERWRVKDLIEYSYGLKEPQVFGLPKWIDSERYDIEAKVEDSVVAKEQNMSDEQRTSLMKLRFQDLLASRFGLRVHHSVKTLPALAVVVATNGPKFSQAKALPHPGAETDGGRKVNMTMDGKEWILNLENAPLRYLILALTGQPEIGGRILVDKTGLTANYTFKLRWQLQDLTVASSSGSEHSGTTLFSALREQLGLRLEARKEPIDVVLVDHVDRPSEN
jgi:uncharacterized protein (TIGR03435 family)